MLGSLLQVEEEDLLGREWLARLITCRLMVGVLIVRALIKCTLPRKRALLHAQKAQSSLLATRCHLSTYGDASCVTYSPIRAGAT